MLTNFVHWYPLAEAPEHAPRTPGVYQVKVGEGLLDYPNGKSAMVCYGGAENLRDAAIELAREHSLNGQFMCRHQSIEAQAVLLEFVLGQFVRRFGKAPTWPSGAVS